MADRLPCFAFGAESVNELGRSGRTTVRGLLPVICPPGADRLVEPSELLRDVESALSVIPGALFRGLRAGLLVYEWGALVVPRHRGRRASLLPLEARRRYFHSWWASRSLVRREFAKAVKGFICLAYYEREPVRRSLKYTADEWIDAARAHRQATYPAAIARHERALREPDPLPRRHFSKGWA